MQIPNGYIVTYQGTWPQPFATSSDSLVSQVLTALSAAGLVSRASPQIGQSFLGGLIGSAFPVTLQLQVSNQGYPSEQDLILVIRNAVYSEAGSYPTSDSIPFVQTDAGSPPIPTGEPGPSPTTDTSACIAGTSNDLTGNFSLQCWFGNLTTKGLGTLGYLFIIIIVGIGIALFAGIRPRVST